MAPQGPIELGSTVLAKVRGYPPWPSVTVGDEDMPESVLAKKPKVKPVYGILFYAENTFKWVAQEDVKSLEPEQAIEALEAPRIKKLLREAYSIAGDPPHYKDYLESISEPASKSTEKSSEPAPASRKRGSSDAPAKTKRSKTVAGKKDESGERKSKSRKKDQQSGADGDSHKDTENSKYDRIELAGPRPRGRPGSKPKSKRANATDVEKYLELRIELCKKVRAKLQRAFLGDSAVKAADMPQLSVYLGQLEDIPNLELGVVRSTKLNRVIAAIAKQESAAFKKDTSRFLARCQALVKSWDVPAEPIVRGIPEHLVKDETQEPEDGDTSRAATSEPESGVQELDGPVLPKEEVSQVISQEAPKEVIEPTTTETQPGTQSEVLANGTNGKVESEPAPESAPESEPAPEPAPTEPTQPSAL